MCRETNPEMIALYNEFNSQGLEIISISLDSNKSEWLEALKKTVYYGLITVPN
ncbi:MAG: thioredoxin-like domain-containing protein [Butyricimonas faecihominis]|uniref:thioredoxin-like domain-containing protein n=1 Tax=Butyricimonas faecihominis TaxID=1472416 RepID=UPI00303639E6